MAGPLSKKYLKKISERVDWKIIALAVVFFLAIFLRVYHFHDWLFFKMDQARDAFTIQQAFTKGPGWLPLLGPKAGGTSVNLGPFFYYFQYLSAVIFQSVSPQVLAYPDLLFSILSIPLFYLFLKKYFSRDWSMILAGIYALCFLGIEYSRFAWNPNSLVFFNLLYFFAVLNIFDERVKYKLRWFVIAGLSFAISTQLHFLSFATLPVITLIFLFFSRQELKKYLNWKTIAIFLALIFLVYLPVAANEIGSHGKNTAAFFAAVKSKPSHHSLWQNIQRDFRYWGQNWFLIATSWISKKASLLPAIAAWFGIMLPGLYLGVRFFRSEKNGLKKKFLLVSILWFISYFLIYIPIAYQIRPRFFLPLLALPFIFVGFIAEYFWRKNKMIWKVPVAAVLAVILLGNLAGTYLWFKEMASAEKKGMYPQRTIILKARDGIVLWHLEQAARFMAANCAQDNVYYDSNSEYRRPIKYLLGLNGKNGLSLADAKTGDPSGCYFGTSLTRTDSGKLSGRFEPEFSVTSGKKIGALTVQTLEINESFSGQALPTFHKSVDELQNSKRVFWKDVLK
ncbi:MAG TPA: glycosyltransferase family 39 protein [Candidatus Bathyarchaeia archaeon]|nr:glycosyltransferase family 39 protein [Candidatus Bathyarchaeia archaeon]